MKRISLFLLPAIILLIGCGTSKPLNPRYINSPAGFSPAFLKQKGDAKASFDVAFTPSNIGSSSSNGSITLPRKKSYGVGMHTAYALTNHFMMTLGGYYRHEKDCYFDNDITQTQTPSVIDYKRNIVDIGIGYYGDISGVKKVYFNALAGVAFGSNKSLLTNLQNHTGINYFFDTKSQKFYITPSIQFFFSPYFRMALQPKFSLMRYNNFATNYGNSNLAYVGLNKLRDSSYYFAEPGISFQWGFKQAPRLKLDMGLNFCSAPNMKKREFFSSGPGLNSRSFLLSLGFSIYPFER